MIATSVAAAVFLVLIRRPARAPRTQPDPGGLPGDVRAHHQVDNF
jgi:hypothetical protein